MRKPLFVRDLSDAEREALTDGLRSANAFTLRRCQIILASAQGKQAAQIAQDVGRGPDMVLDVIHAFNATGLAVLIRQSNRPHELHAVFNDERRERLRAMLHQSPRTYGKATDVWTLGLAAEVSFAQGITPTQVSDETIRQAVQRLGWRWKRAKTWINSPDPDYARKKGRVIG
jgi:transposase